MFDYFLPELSSKLNIPKYDRETAPFDPKEKFQTEPDRAQKLTQSVEAKNFFYILLIMKLIDEKKYDLAKEFVDFAAAQIKDENSRTLDHTISKIYFYKGMINEKVGTLSSIVPEFFDVY